MTPKPKPFNPKAHRGVTIATAGSSLAAGGLLAWLYAPPPWNLWGAIGLAAIGLLVQLGGLSLLMEARRDDVER